MCSKACLTIFLILVCVTVRCQDITGLWQGTLYNDTTQQFYRYEVAISEERGKLSGYSHTWFILDGQQFYGVKKVKVRKMKDKIVIEDDGLVANNYPVPPAKNIRQLNILTYSESDTSRILSGPFTTNRTREYKPLTGSISLTRKKDYRNSSLVPHLEELQLEGGLSFVEKDKHADVATVETKTASLTPKREVEKPIAKASERVESKVKQPVMAKVLQYLPPAHEVDSREEVLQQSVVFFGDTLQLSLFDNGEVDGDTVSVLMNGNLIIPKAGLSTRAVQYTVDATTLDSVKLVMYAENLGTIAPNTGLLVVKVGRELHEIRFSGNLRQNAAIVFRKKKQTDN